jgi:hypothetical protein
VAFKEPPVGRDRPGGCGVQVLIAGEFDGGRIGEPRPQQGTLTIVATDDDRLAAAMPSSANGTIRARNSASEP